jgi:hypothetical protein
MVILEEENKPWCLILTIWLEHLTDN